MVDLYRDFVYTRNTVGIGATDTTISCEDVSLFPGNTLLSKGDFWVVVESQLTYPNTFEVMKVTAVDTGAKTLTVTRGQAGTTAQAHALASYIKGSLDSDMLRRARAGFYGAALPTADPDLYVLNDRFTLTTNYQQYVFAYVNSAYTWQLVSGGSSGSGSSTPTVSVTPNTAYVTTGNQPFIVTYGGGNIATTQNVWTDVAAATNIQVPAKAGDVIMFNLDVDVSTASAGEAVFLDLYLSTSNTYASGGLNDGISAWRCQDTQAISKPSGPFYYTVKSTDVAGNGNVAVNLRYRQNDTNNAGSILADGTNRILQLTAWNMAGTPGAGAVSASFPIVLTNTMMSAYQATLTVPGTPFDGHTNSNVYSDFEPTSNSAPGGLIIDMGGPYDLASVNFILYYSDNRTYHSVVLEGSLDNSSYTTLLPATEITSSVAGTTVQINSKYRYLRLSGTGGSTANTGFHLIQFSATQRLKFSGAVAAPTTNYGDVYVKHGSTYDKLGASSTGVLTLAPATPVTFYDYFTYNGALTSESSSWHNANAGVYSDGQGHAYGQGGTSITYRDIGFSKGYVVEFTASAMPTATGYTGIGLSMYGNYVSVDSGVGFGFDYNGHMRLSGGDSTQVTGTVVHQSGATITFAVSNDGTTATATCEGEVLTDTLHNLASGNASSTLISFRYDQTESVGRYSRLVVYTTAQYAAAQAFTPPAPNTQTVPTTFMTGGSQPYGTLFNTYDVTNVPAYNLSNMVAGANAGYLTLTASSSESRALLPDHMSDGEISFDMRGLVASTGGNSQVDFGVLFRVSDDGQSGYLIGTRTIATSGSPEIALYKFTGVTNYTNLTGQQNPLALSAFDTNLDITILIRMVGDVIRVYADGDLVGIFVDSTYTTGRVGFRAVAPAEVMIGSINLLSIASTDRPKLLRTTSGSSSSGSTGSGSGSTPVSGTVITDPDRLRIRVTTADGITTNGVNYQQVVPPYNSYVIYNIQAGMHLKYDLLWESANVHIALDLNFSGSGTAGSATLRDSSVHDVNDGSQPHAVYTSIPANLWVSREFDLSGWAGANLNYWIIAFDKPNSITSSLVAAQIRNARIVDANNRVVCWLIPPTITAVPDIYPMPGNTNNYTMDAPAVIPGGQRLVSDPPVGDTAWTTPTLQNSYAPQSNLSTVQYRMDALGIVHLRGTFSSGTSSATAFTLPAAYAPDQIADFRVLDGGRSGYVEIHTDGSVLPTWSGGYICLDGISYLAGSAAGQAIPSSIRVSYSLANHVRGSWSSAVAYVADDLVVDNNTLYIAYQSSTGVQPSVELAGHDGSTPGAAIPLLLSSGTYTGTAGPNASSPNPSNGAPHQYRAFSYTAAATGTVNFDSLHSDGDSYIIAYSDIACTQVVGYGDDNAGESDGSFSFTATQGQTYWILVGGYQSGNTPNIVMHYSGLQPAPPPTHWGLVGQLGGGGDPAWIPMSLTNGATNLSSGGFSPAAYRKMSDGTVQLRGVITGAGSGSSHVTFFTMPAGYRPANTAALVAFGDGNFATINIQNDGTMYVGIGSGNSYFGLDSCRYLAEQ